MTRRRLKLVAAIAAVPLAVWLIYLLSFALWQWVKPPVTVRYEIRPTIGGTTVAFEAWTDGGYWVADLHPPAGANGLVDGHGGFDPDWRWRYDTGYRTTYPAEAVEPLAPAGRWLTPREGEVVPLFVRTDADGVRRTFAVGCLPRAVIFPGDEEARWDAACDAGRVEEIAALAAARRGRIERWFARRRPSAE